MAGSAGKHIAELQSLRGLAAATVLIGHSTHMFETGALREVIAWPLNAHAAVVFFFVLSGFVLTRAIDSRRPPLPLALFYVRRVFRLYPAVWVSIGLGVIAACVLAASGTIADTSGAFEDTTSGRWPTVVGIVGGVSGLGNGLNPPLWSVSLELVASALMPLLVVTTRGPVTTWLVGGSLLLLSLVAGPTPHYIATYLVDFWIGAMIHMRSDQLRPLVARLNGPLLVVLFLVLILTRRLAGWEYHGALPQLFEALVAAVIIARIALVPGSAPILKARPLQYLGDISFSLYVVHYPLLLILVALVGTSGWGLALPVEARSLIVAGGTIAATLVLSHFCYHYVELKGIALGRRAEQWLAERRWRGALGVS